MSRTLSWRPDRFHVANCDDCRIMPAVVNGRCVKCDYAHWQAVKAQAEAEAQAQAIADSAELAGILEAEYRDAMETERDLRSSLHW